MRDHARSVERTFSMTIAARTAARVARLRGSRASQRPRVAAVPPPGAAAAGRPDALAAPASAP
ncbi:hypothetical protein, partial [Burkholderia latens]|uniref:hypothetical protein n=1 Tax=Burkholderia latens TaxID=488446 RepID=UPI001BA4D728